MGVGVLFMVKESEFMYMWVWFGCVIIFVDFEFFYIMNFDGSEGLEFSIFLICI